MLIERSKIYWDEFGKEMTPTESYLAEYANVYGVSNIHSLFLLYDALKKKYPDSLPLFLFEDIEQCKYTSMHASLSNFSPEEELNEIENFHFILDELNTNELSLSDIETELNFTDNFSNLKKVNEEPFPLFYKRILIKLCPVQSCEYTFAAEPNGYFIGDLQPKENYAIIRHLKKYYQYEYIGIGSVFLLFKSNQPLGIEKGKLLCNELSKLYQFSPQFIESILFEHITSRNYLVLPYADNFEDFISNIYNT